MNRFTRIRIGQVAMLEALLRSPDGTATIDDATRDPNRKYSDKAPWRGSIVRGLSAKKIIRRVAADPSRRPSRNSGLVGRWVIVDMPKALILLRRLKAALGGLSEGDRE